jgi:3-oxoadipate enol-lactonase
MPYVNNGAARIFWDGQGAGTPILLVMGASWSSRMWYPAVDALAEHHRVIWFDNRGVGDSAPVRTGSIEDMALDAAAVLDAAGCVSAHVYGVSLGGVVALQLGLQAPERVSSLVLGCTGILSADKPRAPRALSLLTRLPAGVRQRLLAAAGKGGHGSAASAADIAVERTRLAENRCTTIAMRQQHRALRGYSADPQQVAALHLPALVLHGTQDDVVPYSYGQELAETLPDARFLSLDGAGHNYLVARRDQANDAVLTFLAEVDRPGSGEAVLPTATAAT